jgi:lipoprotein LpqH
VEFVDYRVIACATAALIVGSAAAGCSSAAPQVPSLPGALSAGTAEVSIDGGGAESTTDVRCSTTGSVTTIETGDDNAGTMSSVNSQDGLAVQFAQIRDIGGFTGSYWAELNPAAKAQLVGRTFELSGTADGFTSDNPSARTTGKFSIKVAC